MNLFPDTLKKAKLQEQKSDEVARGWGWKGGMTPMGQDRALWNNCFISNFG